MKNPITKKEYIFIGIIVLSAVLFLISFKYIHNFWFLLLFLFIHVCFALFLASISNKIWFMFIFPLLWLIGDLLVDFLAPLVLIFGLSFAVMYFMANKNLRLRIKIDFQQSVRPAMVNASILSILLFCVFVAVNTDRTYWEGVTEAFVPEEITLLNQKVPSDITFDELIEIQMKSLVSECQDNAECAARIKTEAKEQVFAQMGVSEEKRASMGNESVVSYQISNFFDQIPVKASYAGALLLLVVFAPIFIVFAITASIFATIVFSLMRMFGILKIMTVKVEQELLI